MKTLKFLALGLGLALSSQAFAYDEVKCNEYMSGDQVKVEQMIKSDILKAAKTPGEVKLVKGLDTDTLMGAGYVLYCIKDNIDILTEVGAK